MDTNTLLKKCAQFGKSATPQRMSIFEQLSHSPNGLSAYDLLAQLRSNGHGFNISTVYRVLDFWIELGLVHKIESNNTYLVCNDTHTDHFHVLFHCTECNKVEESCHNSKQILLPDTNKFSPKKGQVIELKGVCNHCQ